MKVSTLFFQSDRMDETDALCAEWIKKTGEMKTYYGKWVDVFERFANDLVTES